MRIPRFSSVVLAVVTASLHERYSFSRNCDSRVTGLGKPSWFTVTRASLLIWGLLAAGCIAVVGYSYAKRTHPAGAEPAERRGVLRTGRGPGALNSSMEANRVAPRSNERTHWLPLPASADPVFALATDVSSQYPATREAAIKALATAPPKQAISVLQEVLSSGEPRVDRPLALASLREMALNHGDADTRIRDAIRYAIQHSDAAFAREAQGVLEEIENSISRGEPVSAH
jgi:hypothetical protein